MLTVARYNVLAEAPSEVRQTRVDISYISLKRRSADSSQPYRTRRQSVIDQHVVMPGSWDAFLAYLS